MRALASEMHRKALTAAKERGVLAGVSDHTDDPVHSAMRHDGGWRTRRNPAIQSPVALTSCRIDPLWIRKMRTIALLFVVLLGACSGPKSQELANRPPSLSVAQSALDGGSPDVALRICSDTARREPRNTAAQICAGNVLAALGRHADAEVAFERALQMAPENDDALMGLGRLRLATDPPGAEALFQHVVEHQAANADAWNDIGIARDLQGHHEDAQVAYGRALGLMPSMSAAEVNMALSMAMSGHADEAVRRLRRLGDDPTASPRVRENLAAALAMVDKLAALPTPAQATNPVPPGTSPVSPGAGEAPAGDSIVLRATANSWVHVRDRHGRELLNRLMHAGDTWSVPPDAEPAQLLLTTGNAGGIDIMIDGQLAPSLGKSGAARHRVPLDPVALREGAT
jgi:Flp pilus assembly protein TadD